MFPSGVPMTKKMKQELDGDPTMGPEIKVERLSRKRRHELTPPLDTPNGKRSTTRADVTAKAIRSSTRRRRVKMSQNESYLSSCTHKFDGDILESIIYSQAALRDPNSEVLSNSDERGLLMLLCDYLSYMDTDIEVEVPESFDELFGDIDSNAGRALRYLERASLQVQLLKIHASAYEKDDYIPLPELLADPEANPKLWLSSPSGEVNFPILRLLLESILSTVVNKPGVTLQDLAKSHAFVLQSETLELIEILEEIGCLTLEARMLKPLVKSSPFQKSLGEEVLILMPTKDGLERFAAFLEQMDRTMSSGE